MFAKKNTNTNHNAHNAFNGSDDASALPSRSLMKGDFIMDGGEDEIMGMKILQFDNDEELDGDGDDDDDVDDVDDALLLLHGEREKDDGQFQLHLPDFERLVARMSGNHGSTSTHQEQQQQQQQTLVSPIYKSSQFNQSHNLTVSNLSIGTPSVKSSYYHSATSRLDSDGEVVESDANDSEYESLFSEESYLSVTNELSEADLRPMILQNENNTSNIIPPQPLHDNDDGGDDDDYQSPAETTPSSKNTPTRSSHVRFIQSPIRMGETRSTSSLSPAASNLLESDHESNKKIGRNPTFLASPDRHHRTPMKPPTSPSSSLLPPPPPPPAPLLGASPGASTSHKRLVEPIDFLKDDPRTMTYSRRIALFLSRRYRWYNPRMNRVVDKSVDIEEVHDKESSGKETGTGGVEPSIEVAWAYYEHMTLPRRLIVEKTQRSLPRQTSFKDSVQEKIRKHMERHSKGYKLSVAVPGEMNYLSKLYSPLTTPFSQLGDFGLGVGLYFGTLRAFTVLLFIAGLMNIPNILFFAGPEYSQGQDDVAYYLKGSAVCSDHEWVPCYNCLDDNTSPLRPSEKEYRLQTVTHENGQTMTFVLKNLCNGAQFRVGMVNFGTILVFICGMVIMARYLHKKQVQFDLDEQTAQDYSIVIHNPPKNARDPEEWRDYFKSNFPDCNGMHVTSCTVALDNDNLLEYLTKRRELIEKLKDALPDVNDVQNMEELNDVSHKIIQDSNCIQRLLRNTFGVPAMCKRLQELNQKIKELALMDHPVTSVFVMFETEMAQRHVLEKLTVSRASVKKNDINALSNPKHLFRDDLVLDVSEAEEPSTIRWKELNLTTKDFLVKIASTVFVFGIIVAVAFIVDMCNDRNENLAAIAIAIANTIFPQIAKLIASFERHSREEHLQVWLYVKIAFFRWVNTAVVITIITPFTYTTLPNEKGVLTLVYKIFFSEIITSTVIQWLDPAQNLMKHVMAPRAATQEKMNLVFRGSEIFLAERYTNLTKIVFLAVWYCPLYPAVLFMASVALLINYFLDRFSIMRTWKPLPKLGESISHFTKVYVFPVTVVVMTFVAGWSWSSFRFDYVCETRRNIETALFNTTWSLTPNDFFPDTDTSIVISEDTTFYAFCNSSNWKTPDQSRLHDILYNFAYVNVGIVGIVLIIAASCYIKKYYYAKYEPVGEDQGIPMRHVESISAYIPQVVSSSIPYPLIACNVENIKESDLFEWEDPLRSYEYYDLTRDAKRILSEGDNNYHDVEELDESKVFSKMVYWPYRSSCSAKMKTIL